MAKITFEDKVALREVLIPRKNAITAEDINEIKQSVNELYDNPAAGLNIYNSDGSLDENRNVDLANFLLRFFGGKVVFGDDLSLPYFLQINAASESINGLIVISSGMVAFVGSDATGVGLRGSTTSGVGVDAVATSTGTALKAASSSGLSTHSVGKLLIESTDTGANTDSAIFEVNSTTLGSLPAPRMNQTQINALAILDTGLLVFNTTRVRYEFWNGSYFQGIATRSMNLLHGTYATPSAGALAHFGGSPVGPQTAVSLLTAFNFTLRGNGVIRGCNFTSWASGVAGSNESWELYIIINNRTSYLVASVSTTNHIRIFNNSALNIPYVDGDTVRMYYKNPNTWSQAPTLVFGQGTLILQ